MRAYELMVILDPEIDERTVAPSMEKYLQQVTAAKGTVENVDIWGKRRLAYDINKRSEGIYVVVDMTTTPDVALEITRQMNLNEAILRTQRQRPAARGPHRGRTPRPHTPQLPFLNPTEEPTWPEKPSSRSSAT